VRQGSLAKGPHLLVELPTDPRHLGLGDPGVGSECRDEVVDLARRDPVHVSLHDDGVEGLVNAPAPLEHGREERTLSQFGYL